MATNVVGLFEDRLSAEHAVQDLMNRGFDRKLISVVAAAPSGQPLAQAIDEEGSFVAKGTSVGVVGGAVVGGLIGMLMGAGVLLLPLGLAVAGPIAGLLTGGAVGAASGGLIGAFNGLGVPKEDADAFDRAIQRGATLIVVQAEDSQLADAHQILDHDGAIDIDDRGVLYRAERFERTGLAEEPFDDEARQQEDSTYTEETSHLRPARRIRTYTTPGTTVDHAYADNPANAPRVGETTELADTMGGPRPRFDSIDGR